MSEGSEIHESLSMIKLESFNYKYDGSRLLVTSRLRSIVKKMHHWTITFLGKTESWDLFCANVFGEGESLSPSVGVSMENRLDFW